MTDEEYMLEAIKEARLGTTESDEVPIGAVMVMDGKIIARAHNLKEAKKCAVYHAEMLALARAADYIGNWHLEDCTLYVTLEPCPMCVGAMINSRLGKLVYGAYDSKAGAINSVIHLNNDRRFNHRFDAVGGVLEGDCASMLSEFFKEKRATKKAIKLIDKE